MGWLFEARKRYGLRVHNYTVTSNHIHFLVVDGKEADTIPSPLQLIAGRTGQQYNQRKQRREAFGEDRYHATAVESGEHLIQCLVYIDLNTVRAGVVRHPNQWPCSRYRGIQNPKQRYGIIDYERLIELLRMKHLAGVQGSCKGRVEEALRREEQCRQAKWTESIVVGSEQYVEALKKGLASISTLLKRTNSWRGRGTFGLRRFDDHVFTGEPRHGSRRVGQPGSNKVRVMSAFVELDDDAVLFNDDGRRDIQEVSEDLLCLRSVVFATDTLGHEPIEGTGHESDLEIEVDLEANHGREGVEMEELNGFGDSVLDKHSLRVTRNQVRAADLEIVGEQNGGLLVAKINDRDLAQRAAVFLQFNALIENLGSPETAGQGAQRDPAPSGGRPAPDLAEHLLGTPPQGYKQDATPVEFLQLRIGCELGVKDQFGGQRSGLLLPEVDKTQDLAGLLSLGNSGVGIAKNPLGGIARQKNENALLAPAAAGDVVLFQRLFLRIGRDGMKIEID